MIPGRPAPQIVRSNYIHTDGVAGYPTLPKGLSKEQKRSFYKIEVPGTEVVESASAAPGEKRAVTKPAAKKTAAKKA